MSRSAQKHRRAQQKREKWSKEKEIALTPEVCNDQLDKEERIFCKQCRILVKLRSLGASMRGIAKFSGMSKSMLYRQWPAIERYAQLSQVGQLSIAARGEDHAELSQMGHDEALS